jgi:hypothetical protein
MQYLARLAILTLSVALTGCSSGNPLKGDWGVMGMLYAHFDDTTATGLLVSKASFDAGVTSGLQLTDVPVPYTIKEEGEKIKVTFDYKGRKFSTILRKMAGGKLATPDQVILEKAK